MFSKNASDLSDKMSNPIYQNKKISRFEEKCFDWIFSESQNFFDYSEVLSKQVSPHSSVYINMTQFKNSDNYFHEFFFLGIRPLDKQRKLKFSNKLFLDSVIIPRPHLSLEQLYFEVEQLFIYKFRNKRCDICKAIDRFPVVTKKVIEKIKQIQEKRMEPENNLGKKTKKKSRKPKKPILHPSNSDKFLVSSESEESNHKKQQNYKKPNSPKKKQYPNFEICNHVSKMHQYWGYFSSLYNRLINSKYLDQEAMIESLFNILEMSLGLVNAINVLWQLAVSDFYAPIQLALFDLVVIKATKLNLRKKADRFQDYEERIIFREDELKAKKENAILVKRVQSFSKLFQIITRVSSEILDYAISGKWAKYGTPSKLKKSFLSPGSNDLSVVNQLKAFVDNNPFMSLVDLTNLKKHFSCKNQDSFFWNRLYFHNEKDITFFLKKLSLREVSLIFFYALYIYWKLQRKHLKLSVYYIGDASLLSLFCLYRGYFFKYESKLHLKDVFISHQNVAKFQSQISVNQLNRKLVSPFEYENNNHWRIGNKNKEVKIKEKFKVEELIYSKAIQGHYYENKDDFDLKFIKKKETRLKELKMFETEEISYIETHKREQKVDKKGWDRDIRQDAPGDWDRKIKRNKKKKKKKTNDFPKLETWHEPSGRILNEKEKGQFHSEEDSLLVLEDLNKQLESNKGKSKKGMTLKKRLNEKKKKKILKQANKKKSNNPFYGQVSKKLTPEEIQQALDSDDSNEDLKRKINILETKGLLIKDDDFPTLGDEGGSMKDSSNKKSEKNKTNNGSDILGESRNEPKKISKSSWYATPGVKEIFEKKHLESEDPFPIIKTGKKKNKRKRKRRK